MIHLACLTINHSHASIAERERVSVFLQDHRAYLDRLKQSARVRELFLVSTCNRTELYIVGDADLGEYMQDLIEHHAKAAKNVMHLIEGRDAAKHLLRVAAGLESMVLGETEIQGQVREAFKLAQAHQDVGPVLSRLICTALYVGKRVRREASLGRIVLSVADLAAQRVNAMQARNIVIIGAGIMAKRLLEQLERRERHITIINRSFERADHLAKRFGLEARPLEDLPSALLEADAVVSAVAARGFVVTPVNTARISSPTHRSAVHMNAVQMFDLGLPRNIDPKVTQNPNIQLLNIDDLGPDAAKARVAAQNNLPKAESIVETGLEAFKTWLFEREVASEIATVVQRANLELTQTLTGLPLAQHRFAKMKRNQQVRAEIERLKARALDGVKA
jgi:glutamyl-tRNA reductase